MYMSNKEQANIMNEQMDPKDPTRTHENMELKTIGTATVALVCIFNSAYFRSPNSLHGLFSCPYYVIIGVSILSHGICKSLLNVCWDVPICVTLMRSDAQRGVFPPKIWHQGECNRSIYGSPTGFVLFSFSLRIGYLHPGYIKLLRVFN